MSNDNIHSLSTIQLTFSRIYYLKYIVPVLIKPAIHFLYRTIPLSVLKIFPFDVHPVIFYHAGISLFGTGQIAETGYGIVSTQIDD